MSDRLKMLREKRGSVVQQMEQIVSRAESEKRNLTSEEVARHTESFELAQNLRTQIAAEMVIIERERSHAMDQIRGMPADAHASPELRDVRAAMAYFARSGDDSRFRALDHRSMSAASGPDGGYVVVPALSSSMTSRIFDESPIYGLARVIDMTSGDVWEEPLDMGESEAEWIGESSDREDTDTPQLGKLSIPLNEIDASQLITQKLLDVSYIDLGAWLEGKITDKFARKEGASFVCGDGILKPQGFLNVETDSAKDIIRPNDKLQYVPTGSATAITADSLRDLYWAMRAPHRKNATWLMASATANGIDKLKNEVGDYIWRPGQTAGAPPELLGRPVEFAEDMPAPGDGALPVAFGDWKAGYTIVQQPGLRLLRDPFSKKPNVIFYAYRRVGGGVANCDAIKLLKCATS